MIHEKHDPLPDCDCHACALHERDRLRAAVRLTTEWEIEAGRTERSVNTDDACAQLVRYGGGVFDDSLLSALQAFTDLNDDIWHARHKSIIVDDVNKIKQLLDKVLDKHATAPPAGADA